MQGVRRVADRGRSRFVPASGGDIALQRIKVPLPFLSHLLFALALIVRGGNERHGFVDFDQDNLPNEALFKISLRSIEIHYLFEQDSLSEDRGDALEAVALAHHRIDHIDLRRGITS